MKSKKAKTIELTNALAEIRLDKNLMIKKLNELRMIEEDLLAKEGNMDLCQTPIDAEPIEFDAYWENMP